MQPYETMAITLHHKRSHAGSILRAAIEILQNNRVNVTPGHIAPGPFIERLDMENVILSDVAAFLAYEADRLEAHTRATAYTWEIDLAGRVHFGWAADIIAWRTAHPVIFSMTCAHCNGGGCYRCNDVGTVYRTA